MTALAVVAVVAVLVVLCRIVARARRRRRPPFTPTPAGLPMKRPPRRRRRIGDRKRRRQAADTARILAATIATGHREPDAHPDLGVVLQPGETAWQQTHADLATWTTQTALVTHSRARWCSRRVEATTRQVTASSWHNHGPTDWLITSARLAGHNPDGSLRSIWWSDLAAIQIDLDAHSVKLQSATGWRAHITGPGIAQIAVAAIAACQGTPALLTHPRLAQLRARSTPLHPSPPHKPLAHRPGAAPLILRPPKTSN